MLYFRPIASVVTAIIAGILTNLFGVTERPAGPDAESAHAGDGDQGHGHAHAHDQSTAMRMTMTVITPNCRKRPPPEVRGTPSPAQ